MDAGLDPEVMVSGVDESAVHGAPAAMVLELARRKAGAVAAEVPGAVVIGCDSLLELDGIPLGKPGSAQEAQRRWQALRGRQGQLHTGHCVIDGARSASAVRTTQVRFGTPSDAEVEAYIATGEPMQVAGAFTLDGRSAPFIDGIEGDPSNVIGLSLPLLRDLLAELDVSLVDLWC